ncbi:hypothetical protein B0T21DRAFT_405823 [Apiosordaria backusii]|uniref:Polyketide synthase n=1 Tax=Apiosordaria backusii TaxID=314023 RepID=A0AA39ZPM2_9PEZI|nr:hypothetical protein B0T21DRAFT_405823 [Apiosordaria backusii]
MEIRQQQPIAIIGAACRLAGEVSSMGTLWDMISNRKTGHGKIPAERWNADIWHHPDPDRKGGIAVKHGYFLKQDVAHFDAPFFSTTAKEAAAMHPMKRLLLEVSYESIENAGIPVENLINSRTGCYVGCMTNDYEMLSLHDIHDIGHNAASATSEAMTANRVSWFFGLRGPSLTLDTACSSSLYALHLACQSLRTKETDSALVAGVNLLLTPNTMHQLSAMHMLSPEGISHTFDDRANGYGRGEGIGCLIVKRPSDALRDGDTIRAVIRGTGANADGKTPSITQPSSLAQADLIKDTYAAAGLPLTGTQYFECHGTGTPVGDPIELKPLASVGHTEGCSGLAGVFKAIACLENGMLVPTYGVETINPKLKLQDWNLALPQDTARWPTPGQRRISVNSFGFGGANAHAILDDAHHYLYDRGLAGNHSTTVWERDGGAVNGHHPAANTPRLFLLSSKDQAGIPRLADVYAKALNILHPDKKDPHYLGNPSYTLASRRSHLDFRSFAVASGLEELGERLSKGLPKIKRSARQGNNLVWVGNPVFDKSVQASQVYLTNLGCAWNAVEELTKTTDSKMQLSEYSQTLCTVLQVALVDLLRSWGIKPRATVGHSSGEIGAAYAAGYITHADAVKIAYVRGLMSATVTRQGAMLVAGVSREEANEYLKNVPEETAVIACINSPSSVTLSGDLDAIHTLEKLISADGKFARTLKVKTAYHSPHMRAVAQGYLERIGGIDTAAEANDSKTVMYSSLTGKMVSSKELGAQYWVSNLTSPVDFSAALSALLSHTVPSATGRGRPVPVRWGGILGIGPHSALQGPVGQIMAASNSEAIKETPYMSLPLRGKDARETSLTAAGQLWALGHTIDLSAVIDSFDQAQAKPQHKALTDLPAYPWNHSRRFWHEAYITKSNRSPKFPRTDFLGVPVDLQNPMEPNWRNHLRITENPWIEDHKITGTVLYPAAGMLVMALEGALQISDTTRRVNGFRFSNVRFERGLVVTAPDEAAAETSLSLHPDQTTPGKFGFTIYSTTGDSWTRHCHGTLSLEYTPSGPSEVEDPTTTIDPWTEHTTRYKQLSSSPTAEEINVDQFYDHLETIGMEYGPLFRNVTSLYAVPAQHAAHGAVLIPDTASVMPMNFEYPHVMYPATMDAIFHLLLAGFNDGRPIDEAAVPYSIDDMFVANDQPRGAGAKFLGYGQLTRKSGGGRELVGDLIVSDDRWSEPKMVIRGFALRQVTAADDVAGSWPLGESLTKKCARVTWTRDIDFIKSGEQLGGDSLPAQLSAWFDCLERKKAMGEVLLVFRGDNAGASEIAVSTTTAGVVSLRALLPNAQQATTLVLVIGNDSHPDFSTELQKLALLPGSHVMLIGEAGSADTKVSLVGYQPTLRLQGGHNAAVVLASEIEATALPSEVYILLPASTSQHMSILLSNLTAALSTSGVNTIRPLTLSDLSTVDFTSKHVISLLESEKPFIYSWTEAEFTSFKTLISSVSHLFWPTHGSVLQSWAGGVEFAAAQGLLRVLRNEYTLASLPHLDLSTGFDPTTSASAELIATVWRASLVDGAEMEYAELDGQIHIPRTVPDAGFDGDLQLADGTKQPVLEPLHGGKPLKPTIFGAENDIIWVEDEEASLLLGATEVEVQVEFVGLDSGNTFSLSLKPDEDSLVALDRCVDAVGVLSRLGDEVQSLVVGQRVAVLKAQAGRTHIRQDVSLVAPIPTSIAPEEAAALPSAFMTALYALSHHLGAEVFALISSKEEKDVLVEKHGLSATRLFDAGLMNFIPAIARQTAGRGVDVVLVNEPDAAVPASLATLGDFGVFIDLSNSEATSNISPPSSKKNVSSIRINMDSVAQAKPHLIKDLFQQTFNILSTNTISPISPVTLFSASNTSQETLNAKPQPHGKVVALGVNIASMLITLGAQHLVFLSRSGRPKNPPDLARLRESHGITAETLPCDITNPTSVSAVFSQLRASNHTIKGVIQCAMVLEDGIFDNMTHSKWNRAFAPKTTGSRNLLAQLWPGDDKPFFILLSSITGVIGNTAQANYASGNTFEDALALWARTHLGIPATSIDVGLVADSSHLTNAGEFGDLEGYLHRYSHGWAGLQTTLEELRVVLKAVIRGRIADGGDVPAQLVLGLGDNLARDENSAGFARDRKFELRVVRSERGGADGSGAKTEKIGERLSRATTISEAAAAVEEFIKAQIAVAIGVDVGEVDAQKPLPEFGVDSLKAVEIRNQCLREMQSDISVFELLSSTPVAELAVKVASRSGLVKLDADAA